MAWNLVKMYQSTKHLLTTYGEGNDLEPMVDDLTGESRIDHVVSLYREMNIPFGPMMMLKNRVSENGRNIIWGRKWNDREYVEKKVIPTLMNYEYLKSLPANTVGAHYYHLIKDYGIEKLYNQRFKKEERRENSKFDNVYNSFSDDIRENASRHLLLSHDIWHVLFRYDTTPMGEAMIQTITARIFNFFPPHLTGFFGTWKMARKTKSKLPWKVWRECLKLSKGVNKELALFSPIEFLEQDIQEVRDRFNIFTPKVYAEYVKTLPKFARMDTIHPNYDDKLWNAEVI
jgi:ubiquinone biosynthesis protein Coq4|tara:strand:+ start:8633 stop:9493 length:861 start_codon:yes stop_codon:yes gene_type:complete